MTQEIMEDKFGTRQRIIDDNRMSVNSNMLYYKPHRKYEEGLMETEDVEGKYILKVAVHETRLQNEAWLDIWYADSEVTQHVHTNATETFYIISGSAELITTGGIKTVLNQGDIFHCPPGMGHEFHTVGTDLAWYNLFTNLHYWNIIQTEIDMSIHHADKMRDVPYYRNFVSSMNSRKLIPYPPVIKKDTIHEVRRKDEALLKYEAMGVKLNLKVAPWETNQWNEVWEMEFKKGMTVKMKEPFNFWQTYIITEGSAKCTVGEDTFIAVPNDFIQIYPYKPFEVEFTEDAKVLSWGSGYKLLDALEEANYYKLEEPEKLRDEKARREIMERYKLPIFIIE